MDMENMETRGLDLIEVFRVIYMGNAEVPPEKQIGTIKVDDCLRCQFLYHVDRVDASRASIQHGDEIILAGPTTFPILGDGIVTLEIDLFCGMYKDSIHFEDLRPGIESVPMKRVITAADGTGYICALFTVFVDATAAHLEFKLTGLDSTTDAYGIIGASIEAIERFQYTSILYLTKPEQRISMRPGDINMIPLSRSSVAVPLDSRLVLHVNLVGDEDDEVFRDSLEFVPKRGRHIKDEKDFVGKKGRIVVTVTWNCEALTKEEQEKRVRNRFLVFSKSFHIP